MDTSSNKQRLLDEALGLFAERGYDAVGVQEIVEAAGLTKPTLYHYFGSKEGLFEELLRTRMEPFLSRLEEAALYRGDITHNLKQLCRVFFSFAEQDPDSYRLHLAMQFAPPASATCRCAIRFVERYYAILQKLFRAAVDDHGNMRNRDGAYAITFIGTMNTYVSLALSRRVSLNDDLAHRAVHQFMHGIFS